MTPALHEYNLASHLVWWVGGIAFLFLGVVALLELWDALRARLASRPEGDETAADADRE